MREGVFGNGNENGLIGGIGRERGSGTAQGFCGGLNGFEEVGCFFLSDKMFEREFEWLRLKRLGRDMVELVFQVRGIRGCFRDR